MRVLVTGGARGIGAAVVTTFLEQGARVAVGARSMESFEAFRRSHGSDGVVPAIGEIGDREQSARVVAEAVRRLGGLDVLVNSAGVFAEVPFAEVTQSHWDATMRVNAGGTFFCSQAALPALRESRGNVVNIASDAGLIGYPNGCAYSASKAAVVNLTRAMAVELAREIRVNCVCPGNVDTDMIQRAAAAAPDPQAYLDKAQRRAPVGRMARPREVAAAVLYLASPEAGFTNGAIVSVDGGGVSGF